MSNDHRVRQAMDLGNRLMTQGQHEEAAAAYGDALAAQGDAPSEKILFHLGDALRATGMADHAKTAFTTALGVEPDGVLGEIGLGDLLREAGDGVGALRRYANADAKGTTKNLPPSRLASLLNEAAPNWHFPMMNDRPRNEAFQQAIEAAVQPGMVVLDIGAGSGLLALIAARAGAEHVYACESNAPIAEAARQIVAANGLTERITVIEKQSTMLVVGKDLPRRADLLTSEVFDVSVFGEDALFTLRHARRELLEPGAPTIPSGVRVWAVPVHGDALRSRFEVGDVCGFDLSVFNRLADRRVFQLRVDEVAHTALADPFVALEMRLDQEVPLAGDSLSTVEINAAGRLDGFIFWYELLLDDERVLSTAPDQPSTHWRQGFLPDVSGDTVLRAGQAIDVCTAFRRRILWFEVRV